MVCIIHTWLTISIKTNLYSALFQVVSRLANRINCNRTKSSAAVTNIQSLPWRNTVIWAASWQNQQNGMCVIEDSDQPGHPPSLIRVFAVRLKKAWVLSYSLNAQRRLWSDWADAQDDLSLRSAHRDFVGFDMRRLIYCWKYVCSNTIHA